LPVALLCHQPRTPSNGGEDGENSFRLRVDADAVKNVWHNLGHSFHCGAGLPVSA
jgi:hypothetical protein